jgi:hypothetical protein
VPNTPPLPMRYPPLPFTFTNPFTPPFPLPQLYTVSSDDFSVHLKFGNFRNGFMNGSQYEGAPIFWSKLFFYDTPADEDWGSRVVVKNAPKSLQGDACETRIGVEPFTGQIMSGARCVARARVALTRRCRYALKRMQTNLYVSAAAEDPLMFLKYNPKIYRGPTPADGFMMPLFYLDEAGQIAPVDAEMFKSQVARALA